MVLRNGNIIPDNLVLKLCKGKFKVKSFEKGMLVKDKNNYWYVLQDVEDGNHPVGINITKLGYRYAYQLTFNKFPGVIYDGYFEELEIIEMEEELWY